MSVTGSDGSPRWSLGWPIGGYLLAYLISGAVLSVWVVTFGDDGIVVVLIGSLALWVGFFGAPLAASRSQGTGSVIADFHVAFRWRDLPVGVATGIGLQLLILPLLYTLIEVVSGPLDVDGPAQALAAKAASPLGWVAFAVVVGIGAPFAEELFFRGLLRSSIEARSGRWIAIVLSSLLFAATHFQAVQFVGLLIAGLTWAVLADRAGRLGPAIVSHMAFNLTTVATLYLVG